jgi:hypothetical protein
MNLADELLGHIEAPYAPDAPRRVNLVDDSELHRQAIRYERPARLPHAEPVAIPEPVIRPFLEIGARGEVICERVTTDGGAPVRREKAEGAAMKISFAFSVSHDVIDVIPFFTVYLDRPVGGSVMFGWLVFRFSIGYRPAA